MMDGETPETKQQDRTERTALAGDRTMLASERTLAAWWRTALASLAVAVALSKLYEDVASPALIRIAATLPILLAILILFVAARRYSKTARTIEAERVGRVPRFELWIGTALLGMLAAVAAAIIWSLA